MSTDTTLYDILGISSNASQEQIRIAAREKALEHHPDRGGSHEMMQKVNAAKRILTDPEKRRLYDQYGLEGMESRINNRNFPFTDVPNDLFDIFNIFNHGSRHTNTKRSPKGKDIQYSLKISLEEIYSGSTKTIQIDRDIICNNCKGTGSHNGKSSQCRRCHGQGIEIIIQRMGPMIQQLQCECSLCNGKGTIIKAEDQCKICTGKKVIREEKSFDINISHGSRNGETIRLINQANEIPNGESGSLNIILREESHPIFIRKKDNLLMNMEINLTECLCGFQRLIKLLDGHQILIEHPPGKTILPNSYQCLKGYGMPNRSTHSYGDLIIQFDVKFPDENFHLNQSQLKQLESILPPKKQIHLNNEEIIDTVHMTKYDNSTENNDEEEEGDTDGHHTIPSTE
ncbi:hypothetical protein I4U23_017291 [Adineta vaga]|nr:hypothetical protein I4U23_017291 [Adineta vaga]